MNEQQEKLNAVIEITAKICHNVNAEYCKSIGEDDQAPWEEAPVWQKQSAVDGVSFILQNPDVTPREAHDKWVEDKMAAGWKYGEVKDEKEKTHPCIVLYETLPQEQKSKDYIFRSVCINLFDLMLQRKEENPLNG